MPVHACDSELIQEASRSLEAVQQHVCVRVQVVCLLS